MGMGAMSGATQAGGQTPGQQAPQAAPGGKGGAQPPQAAQGGKGAGQPTQSPGMKGGAGQPMQPPPGGKGAGQPQKPMPGSKGAGQPMPVQQGQVPGGKGLSQPQKPMPGQKGQMDPRAMQQPPMPQQGGMQGQQLADGRFANQIPQDTSQQAYNRFMQQAQFAPGGAPTYEQWSAQRQQGAMGLKEGMGGMPQQGGGMFGGQMPPQQQLPFGMNQQQFGDMQKQQEMYGRQIQSAVQANPVFAQMEAMNAQIQQSGGQPSQQQLQQLQQYKQQLDSDPAIQQAQNSQRQYQQQLEQQYKPLQQAQMQGMPQSPKMPGGKGKGAPQSLSQAQAMQGQVPGGKGGQMDPRMMAAMQAKQANQMGQQQPAHQAFGDQFNVQQGQRGSSPFAPPGTNGSPQAYGHNPNVGGFGFGNGATQVPQMQSPMVGRTPQPNQNSIMGSNLRNRR